MAHALSENVSLANKMNTTENEKIENSSSEILNKKTENEQKINQTSDSKTNNENNSTEVLNKKTENEQKINQTSDSKTNNENNSTEVLNKKTENEQKINQTSDSKTNNENNSTEVLNKKTENEQKINQTSDSKTNNENNSTEVLNKKTENEQKINQTSDSKTNNENNSTEVLNKKTESEQKINQTSDSKTNNENNSTEILNKKTESEQKINQTSDSKTNNENNSTEILNEGTTSCFNPSVSDDIEDDLKKLKGDAIGNTLYSERFVLSTLLKLTKIENNLDGNFEDDLCSLWDMTIEEDVVKLLLEHKCLELFSGIIQQTENKRLTEILIGIIGNMCSLRQARDELCNNPNIVSPIFDLISCTDTLTLIQLMRLFCAALVFENSGDELIWLQHFKNSENFVENYAHMLNNSINSTLLLNALEALNAICAKFAVLELQDDDDIRFCELFIEPALLMGVNEAFKLLTDINTKNSNIDNNDENDVKNENKLYTTNPNNDSNCDTPTENLQKIMMLYLDIHVHLSQYGLISKICYKEVILDLMECIQQILSPLCQPICLLPLTYNEQGIIENINELSQAIGDPFDEICYAQMIAIWSIIDEDMNSTKQISNLKKSDSDNNFDCNEDKNLRDLNKDIHTTILEYIIRVAGNASEQQLKESFHYHNMETNMKLLDALDNVGEDFLPNDEEFRNKIKSIFCTILETESVDSNDE